ncbi:MAG: hypothetical protein HY791_05140 [Deltaproteobacteria bacterium]|nr:hypothetical protein [Deltaproteobacteria bacterium]
MDVSSAPEGVDSFAVLPLGEATGSPLHRVGSEALYSLISDAPSRSYFVLGWSDESLLGYEISRSDPLSFAAPHDPPLPEPAWIRSVEGTESTVPTSAPEVTAPWAERCLSLGGVDVRCLACVGPRPRIDCNEVHLDLDECGAGKLDVELADWEIRSAYGTELSGCESREPPSGAAAGLACHFGSNACDVDFYRPPEPMGWEVREVLTAPEDDLGPGAVMGSALVIPGHPPERCAVTRLHRFDLQTGELVSSSTRAGCLLELAQAGGGLVAFDSVDYSAVLLDGGLADRARSAPLSPKDQDLIDLEVSQDQSRAAFLFDDRFVEIDLETMAVVRSEPIDRVALRRLFWTLEGWIVLAGSNYFFVGADENAELSCLRLHNDLNDLLFFRGKILMASANPNAPAVLVLPGFRTADCVWGKSFEVRAIPSRLAVWGDDVAVGSGRKARDAARLSLFDSDTARFALGSVELGAGQVELYPLTSKRMIVTLLFEGRVVVVERP